MKAIKFGLLILILGSATACGQQAYNENSTIGNVPGGQTGGDWGDGNDQNDDDDTSGGGQAATKNYVFTPKIYGNANRGSSQIVKVSTDNVLKVKVSTGAFQFQPKALYPADANPATNGNWGNTIGFNCLNVAITVADETLYAFVARSGVDTTTERDQHGTLNPCLGAKTSETLDFSPRLSGGLDSYDIKVSEVQYDNCRKAGNTGIGGCTMEPVYDVIAKDPVTKNNTRYYHAVQVKLEVIGNTLN